MFNEAHIVLVGRVANEPRYRTVGQNIPVLSMRVVWTTRRRDFATGEWVDGNTSGVTVTCWRKLAENLSVCLRKGDPVLVRGKLEVRNFVGKDGQSRTAVEVEATTLGPDLTRGVAHFLRVAQAAGKTAAQQAAGPAAGGNGSRPEDPVAPGGEAAALAAIADAGADADADMFDDSAIDALAKEADSAAAPF